MPSGPKKRAKAKKKQQRLGSASVHDDLDSRSRSSDDKETDTCDSVDDQEEELSMPKSPLGKSAYSAGEDYHKSDTEKWVRVSNFAVGLPTPRSERATIDFDQAIDDESNGTKSPDWETVDGETVGSLDKKGDDASTLSDGVKPEELEDVLKPAEKDYFSFGNAELSSKDEYESNSLVDSLAVEPGTEVADYSVSSGAVPYDPSLPDSEDQAGNVKDCTCRGSPLVADPSSDSTDPSADLANLNSSTQDVTERVEVNGAPDVRSSDLCTQGAEEQSVASGEQDLHEQVDHGERADRNLSRLDSNEDGAQHHVEATGNLNYRAALSAHHGSSTGELVGGSVSAEPHPWRDAVAGVSKADDKSSAHEHAATPPEVDVAEVGTEVKDLYDAVDCPEVQGGGEYDESEELKDASEMRDEPSSSYETVQGVSDSHVVYSSHQGHASASTASIPDGEGAEEQIGAPEMTTSEVIVELPNDEPLLGNGLTESNSELEERTSDVVSHDELPLSTSFEKFIGPGDKKSPEDEVERFPNGDHVERQSPSRNPATAGKTGPTNFAEATATKVDGLSKLQTADGKSLVGVSSTQSAVSDLQPNNGVLIVDQVKDVRRDNGPGCCGALSWIFGQAD
eukprot:TRINITY_DN228_c0_g1_i1.p1 TRINITY_DN228_c0_g1~~TRINITY_DN228_c0_g1_i1.p1  ORF type:complete len:623 (+),score=131.07 TRINITY_DN228_c0_g1_i1:43-1911(+)